MDDIEGITVLGLSPLALSRSARGLKRAIDVVGSGVGLILLAPLMALVAVAIKLDSRGPILFRQERVGLPQPWNVLKGNMSLVGPRPPSETEDRQVAGWARSRLDLAPGITGMWQVLDRTNIPFEEMVKLDYLYVTSWSLGLDLRLLLETFPVVARRRGAN